MINFITQCSNLIFGIIGKILNIPITNNETPITFGIVLLITIIIGIILKFMFGGKGD